MTSYSAVLSDNDGAAFITMAEFDSLKNNFQKQIDAYNTSIDSKINEAIAAYLAGVRVGKSTSYELLFKDYEEYTILTNAMTNEYKVPDVDGQIFYNLVVDNSQNLRKTLYTSANISFHNAKTSNRRILLENIGIGTTLNTREATWYGLALNCTEHWNMSAQDFYSNGGATSWSNDPGWLRTYGTNTLTICQPLNITKTGYVENWNYKDSSGSTQYWDWRMNWKGAGGGGLIQWSRYPRTSSITPTVTYDADGEGNVYAYRHIGTYTNNVVFECTAKDVVNYLDISSKNTLKANDWYTAATKEGKWTGTEADNGGSGSRYAITGRVYDQNVSWTNNTVSNGTNNAKIPTLGLIGELDSSQIYQYKKFNNKQGKAVEALKLYEGMPLFFVEKKDTVEWTAEFSNIVIGDSEEQHEAELVFSFQPFTNRLQSTEVIRVESDGGKNLTSVTTTNRKVKIKFKADKDGLVICKWRLAENPDTTIWEATLDVEKSKTYVITKE